MPDMFIPIPDKNRDLLKNGQANFSLAFPRLMEWNIKEEKLEKPDEAIKSLFDRAKETVYPLKKELENIHQRQERILKQQESSGFRTITLNAQLTSPFVSGLGSGHPNETGMILDRNTGCPFLPASSIKGVLRTAYALNLAETDPSKLKKGANLPDKELRKYFGDIDYRDDPINSIPRDDRTSGQIVFLDAFPKSPPELKIDIMNPHYSKYYEQGNAPKSFVLPVETESPLPIKFIALEKGSVFVFRCFFLPLAASDKNDNIFSEEDVKTVQVMWETAFSRLGFGGKTAIGYGHFKLLTENEVEHIKKQTVVEASPRELKNGEIHTAILKEIKKEKWRVILQNKSEINGVILNHLDVPSEKKAGDSIQVKVRAKISPTMYNFEYDNSKIKGSV
jgi:CRISPR-associated protein Cmr6